MKYGPRLNKWSIEIHAQHDARVRNPFAFRFVFGICKFLEFPKEGEVIKKGKYKGFIYFFDISFMVVVQVFTKNWNDRLFRFILPIKIKPLLRWY